MVDFDKFLDNKLKQNETDPLLIFERLDKESDKVDLRRNQETILTNWYEKYLERKDTIVKLHTGQGKTLVGLLMLQSSMNEGLGPCVFLCPDTYLVSQTINEANSFGIKTVEFSDTENNPPMEFLNSQAILVTTCQKLFNGLSVFGVIGSGKESIRLGAVVLDDAHTCINIIRKQFSITIPRKIKSNEHPLYVELWNLFQESLMRQGSGSCYDIIDGSYSTMAVPFWTWHDKHNEVLALLRKYKDNYDMRYSWNLIKNNLKDSTCIFSGNKLEITPRLIPIELLPSFANAKRRIFLSATLTEDAFLVNDLNLDPTSVEEPLTLKNITWSGERMILIPSLLHSSLTRDKIIEWLSRFSEKHGEFGVVSLVPSNKRASDWVNEGGKITDVKNLKKSIEELKNAVQSKTARNVTILVNKYDGVDLPDNICRILCLDSMPNYFSLIERYHQEMRPESFIMRRQIAQRLEQGIGRGIRGNSDYCIVVITGNDVTNFVSEKTKREFLSNETKAQIEIAEELALEMNKEEGHKLNIISSLVKQCFDREEGWKEYYRKRMNNVKLNSFNKNYLELSGLEREAELQYKDGNYKKTIEIIQKIIEISNEEDKGWYFQLMATYLYPFNPTESMDKQKKAFSMNNRLHRPEKGINYSRLRNTSINRENAIIHWINQQESPNSLIVKLVSILDSVSFNVESDSFESGIEKLGMVLGFASDRPEKSSGSGPDNLWHITGKQFWVISCKNMVKMNRNCIHKNEANQLISDIGWFEKNYEGCTPIPILIHPSKILDSNAFLTIPSYVITKQNLDSLKQNIINFYNCLIEIPFDSISTEMVTKKLQDTQLDNYSLSKNYLEKVEDKDMKKIS